MNNGRIKVCWNCHAVTRAALAPLTRKEFKTVNTRFGKIWKSAENHAFPLNRLKTLLELELNYNSTSFNEHKKVALERLSGCT